MLSGNTKDDRSSGSARNRHKPRAVEKVGWRVPEWSAAAGCGKSTTNELIRAKTIESVKLGGSRIITTSPAAFLASLAEQQSQDVA